MSEKKSCEVCRNKDYACDMCGPEKSNFEQVGQGARIFGCVVSARERQAIIEKGNSELLSQYCDSTQRDIEEMSQKGKKLNLDLAEAAKEERLEQAKEVLAGFSL